MTYNLRNYKEVHECRDKFFEELEQQLGKTGKLIRVTKPEHMSNMRNYVLRVQDQEVGMSVSADVWGRGPQLSIKVNFDRSMGRTKPDGSFAKWSELIDRMFATAEYELARMTHQQRADENRALAVQFLKDHGLARHRFDCMDRESLDFNWTVENNGSIKFEQTFKPHELERFLKFVELSRATHQ